LLLNDLYRALIEFIFSSLQNTRQDGHENEEESQSWRDKLPGSALEATPDGHVEEGNKGKVGLMTGTELVDPA